MFYICLVIFEEYLIKKKIDSSSWKKNNPEQWGEFKVIFDQVHPNSFTSQKLFLINQIRRMHPLTKSADVSERKSIKKVVKPVMKKPTIGAKPKKPMMKPKMK